jgi:septal ring factor EnvC (AmiA/AmiB activator)
MTDSQQDEKPRRWQMGHGTQLIGIIVALAAMLTPFAIYNNTTLASQAATQATMAATMAAMASRIDRQDREIDHQRQDQRQVDQNLVDVKAGLASITATLEFLKPAKR